MGRVNNCYQLCIENCPKTRVEFIKKYNTDRIFRNKVVCADIKIVGENVVFPNGQVADTHIK